MLRLAGVILLLLGTVGYSFCCCRDMHARLDCLCEMKRMYELFYSQVGYCLAAFPEACRMVAQSVRPPFSEMLRDIYEEAEQNTGKPFPQIWEEQAQLYFPQFSLKKEDRTLLSEFSRSLGYADRELQERAIGHQMDALSHTIEKAETHMAEREKMIMSFGVMGGLLLVIVLL